MTARLVAVAVLATCLGAAPALPSAAAPAPTRPAPAATVVGQVPAATTRATVPWPGSLQWGRPRSMWVRVSPVRAGRLVVLQAYWGSEQGWQVESRARTSSRGYARLTFQNTCFDGACGVTRMLFRVVVPASGRDTALVAARRITLVP